MQHPFYHLKAEFNLDNGLALKIKEILVNGRPVLDFFCYHNGRFQKSFTVNGGGMNEVVSRYDWKSGEEVTLEISGADAKKRAAPFLSAKVKASSRGGYWNPAWHHCAGIVLKETVGVPRVGEPVHVTLGLYSDRVKDPVKELRIVSLDSKTGETKEIPSQVYAVSRYDWDKPDERYQPTTTCEVAFLADVPANSSRVYLAFYGNKNAYAPQYRSGLHIDGEGLGLRIENEFYRIALSEKSGAIDEITIKKGASFTFKHGLETNGALHWNPGIYAPPRPWLHASDWDPPAHYSIIQGPLFAMTKRSGSLDHYPETDVSITYVFYENVPWVLMSSTIDVRKDIDVKALRNGEIVIDRKLVDQFAWRDPEGKTGSMNIQDGPRHPRHAKVLPFDTPWACFLNSKKGCGLGMVTVDVANFQRDGGFSRTFRPYSYLQWGPWAYYARPLVYTFVSSGPGRFIPVPAGNLYYEKMAFVPVQSENKEKSYKYLDQLYLQLANPLYVDISEDTDPRAPKTWMAPILVEEFEEME